MKTVKVKIIDQNGVEEHTIPRSKALDFITNSVIKDSKWAYFDGKKIDAIDIVESDLDATDITLLNRQGGGTSCI